MMSRFPLLLLLVLPLSAVAQDYEDIRSQWLDSLRTATAEVLRDSIIRQDGDSSSLEFPKGFVSVFFDKHQNKTSELTADYGKNYGSLIEAAGNVTIINFGNNEKLFSDKLYWYQDTRMIHTRSHVRIVTPDKEIEGDSLVAKEDFSEYTIYNGKALLELDEDL